MIRNATLDDVPALVEMGTRFLRETAYRDLVAQNTHQMETTCTRLIVADAGVVIVAERDGALTGMIGLLITEHYLSGEQVAMEAFWWSGRGDGARLLRAAEEWAASRNAVAIQVVAPTDRIGQFYERLGYALIERGYMRRLTPCG